MLEINKIVLPTLNFSRESNGTMRILAGQTNVDKHIFCIIVFKKEEAKKRKG